MSGSRGGKTSEMCSFRTVLVSLAMLGLVQDPKDKAEHDMGLDSFVFFWGGGVSLAPGVCKKVYSNP